MKKAKQKGFGIADQPETGSKETGIPDITLFKKAELEWINDQLRELLGAPDGQYVSFRKSTKKRSRDRNRKHRVKLKMKKAIADAERIQLIQDVFSDKEWDEMFPDVSLGLLVEAKVFRDGYEEAVKLAAAVELGLRRRLSTELGKDAELVCIEVPVITKRSTSRILERAWYSKDWMSRTQKERKPEVETRPLC